MKKEIKPIREVKNINVRGKNYKVRLNYYNGVLTSQVEDKDGAFLVIKSNSYNNESLNLMIESDDDAILFHN